MAASLTPCFSNRGMALCSWTSCPLQNGHQSAERKKRRTVPFVPFKVLRVCTFPNWSRMEKVGAFWPTASPMDINSTEATRIVSSSSVPRTVTESPRRAVTNSCGSSEYMTLLVSSYSANFAPGTFLAHSGDSLNPSSALQALVTIVPDHDLEFVVLSCPTAAMETTENSNNRKAQIRLAAEKGPWGRINSNPSLPLDASVLYAGRVLPNKIACV